MINETRVNYVKAAVRVPFDWMMNPPSVRLEHLSMHLAQVHREWIIYSLKPAKIFLLKKSVSKFLALSWEVLVGGKGITLCRCAIYATIFCIRLESMLIFLNINLFICFWFEQELFLWLIWHSTSAQFLSSVLDFQTPSLYSASLSFQKVFPFNK